MKRGSFIVGMFLVPIIFILIGIGAEIDFLLKGGLFIFLFFIVLGVFYGQDKFNKR